MKTSFFFHSLCLSFGLVISSANLLAEDLPLNPELVESVESDNTSEALPQPDASPTIDVANATEAKPDEGLVEEPVTIIEPEAIEPEVVEPTDDSVETANADDQSEPAAEANDEIQENMDESPSEMKDTSEALPEPKIEVMESEEIEIENVATPEPIEGKQTHVDSKGEAPHPITGILKRSKRIFFMFKPPYAYQLVNLETGKRIAYVDISQLSNDSSLSDFLNEKVTITGKLGKGPKGKHVKIEAYHIF